MNSSTLIDCNYSNNLYWQPSVFKTLISDALKCEMIQNSKHSACLVYKNKIIARGIAKRKTHPLMLRFSDNQKKIYLHAELSCIVKAINTFGVEILSECSLYCLRITKGNAVGLSKPCSVCQAAINTFNIRNVYWSL